MTPPFLHEKRGEVVNFDDMHGGRLQIRLRPNHFSTMFRQQNDMIKQLTKRMSTTV